MTALMGAAVAVSVPTTAYAATTGGVISMSSLYGGCQTTLPASVSSGVAQVGIYGSSGRYAALKDDGTVVGWNGAVIPAGASSGVVNLAADPNGLNLVKSDGSVVAVDNDGNLSTVLPASTGAVAISGGMFAAMALKDNGAVVAWGEGAYGGSAPGSVTAPGSGVTAIDAALYTFYAVKSGGVVAWGSNSSGAATPPGSASSGVVAVAGGSYHALALKSDGSVIAWGSNSAGQTTVPAAAGSGVVAIRANDNASFAIKSDGSVVMWGSLMGGACGVGQQLPQSGVLALSDGWSSTVVAVRDMSLPQPFGGTLTSAPTVSKRPGSATQDVFYLDGNSQVIHRTMVNGHLGAAENLGGTMKAGSSVAAVSWASNRIDVFARGTEDALWHNSFNGSVWSGWSVRSSAGHISSSPTVASWGTGRLDVFARGSANDLQHTVYDSGACSGWCSWGWESLGGVLSTAPAAVSWGANRIDVFVGDTGNQLAQVVWNGSSWNGWYAFGGVLTSDPSVSSSGSGKLDIYARNGSNGLSSLQFGDGGGGWGSWQSLGSMSSPNGSTPAVSSSGTGDRVFFRGNDNALWSRVY